MSTGKSDFFNLFSQGSGPAPPAPGRRSGTPVSYTHLDVYKRQAQARATEYAQEVIRACKHRPYRIGGHSKGGNLAAWAAVHLPEKLQGKRLLAAYNNDGPGFHADLLDTRCV